MNLIKIGQASKILGVTPQTIRQWELSGELLPDRKSSSGTRYYDLSKLTNSKNIAQKNLCYARVSSKDQEKDLETQVYLLETFCVSNGWTFSVIKDIGSGLNYKKNGLKELINLILEGNIKRLILTHKDRLLRFGSEIIFSLCEKQNVQIIIINDDDNNKSFEEELAEDVLEIITVFSARLYGSRSHKNKKLLKGLRNVISTQNNS